MNKLAFALGIATVVFASTTVYFAHAFYAARERAAGPPPMRVASGGASTASLRGDPVNADAPATPSPPAPAAASKARQIALSQARLDQLIDPRGRAERLANLKNMLHADWYPLAKAVGLSRDELEQIVSLQAEQSLRRAESRLRCEVAPGCVSQPGASASKEADRQEMVQLLGEEKVARYEAYIESSSERFAVEQLRSRISEAGPVSDAQAERLVTALAEERRRVTESANTEGTAVQTYSLSGFALATGDSRTAAGRTRQLESAPEFIRRVHDRAAQILTPAQLAALDELQDQQLRQLRESLKLQELGDLSGGR